MFQVWRQLVLSLITGWQEFRLIHKRFLFPHSPHDEHKKKIKNYSYNFLQCFGCFFREIKNVFKNSLVIMY